VVAVVYSDLDWLMRLSRSKLPAELREDFRDFGGVGLNWASPNG